MLEFLQELLIELACEYLSIERHAVTEVRFIPEGISISYDVLDGWDDRIIGEAEEIVSAHDIMEALLQ